MFGAFTNWIQQSESVLTWKADDRPQIGVHVDCISGEVSSVPAAQQSIGAHVNIDYLFLVVASQIYVPSE